MLIKLYDINIYIEGLLIALSIEWSGAMPSLLSTTDTRDIYDVGCLIDHHRPNQVNFYTRIRLVSVGFCHPAIPQSIEEDRALSSEH